MGGHGWRLFKNKHLADSDCLRFKDITAKHQQDWNISLQRQDFRLSWRNVLLQNRRMMIEPATAPKKLAGSVI
jgi:hypothetical protein